MPTSPSPGVMTPAQFVAKWSRVELSERAASQEHFIDLCRLLGQPTPAEHDATGAEYTFEKGVAVTSGASAGSQGERGFADVWWRGKFGWEYKRKGKHRNLDDAYRQLCQYREALDNPPLLIVCDIARIEIHTNFTGTTKQVHPIALDDLPEPASLDMLRRVFTDPDSFRPQVTTAKITEDVAGEIAKLAQSLHQRGHDPHAAAHFLMRCMFCLFAEDVALFGSDPDTGKPIELFRKLLSRSHAKPEQLTDRLSELFDTMRTGGAFGSDDIPWFNGGLFDDTKALPLTGPEIGVLLIAAGLDWSSVEPAIFGTLFERSLDPTKRAQIGAHYTSRDDIMLVVEPVILAPLRREWASVQGGVDKLLERRRAATTKPTRTKADASIADALQGFLHRLSSVRILDPACGSGNFLYVAIQQLLNLEKEVITYAARPDIAVPLLPTVRPTQLAGIEINPYAAELAQVVIWIGYLQWMRENGFNTPRDPILENLSTIENRDAILDRTDPANPAPAKWPTADFIIGNPPFLGCRMFRQYGLSDDYINALHAAYPIPQTSDLCCYWFERGRAYLDSMPHSRIGLLATQAIRATDNREVLNRITSAHRIFAAWSDRPWVLDGAAVRVAIIGYTNSTDERPVLDGAPVDAINADLSTGADVTQAKALPAMRALSFQGPVKVGDFDIDTTTARKMLGAPAGPTGRYNSEVLKRWYNGSAITSRYKGEWIIDFALLPIEEAALFESPFEHVRQHVKPFRDTNRREGRRDKWWLFGEPNPNMRKRIINLPRFIATPRVAKHRLWVWLDGSVSPDARIVGIASDSDYLFGSLHSGVHELWTLSTCAWHGVGNDPTYNNSVSFDNFPLPWPPGKEPTAGSPHRPLWQRISDAARELNEQRERWLNPPEWIEPLAASVDAMDRFADVPPEARPLIRQSAIMALAAKDARLKKRTLTNLYNERPTWLKLAHEKLDRAVLAAYAATDPAGQWSQEWAEVWKETGAGQPLPAGHTLATRRAEVDQAVLANLLRLNQARAGAP